MDLVVLLEIPLRPEKSRAGSTRYSFEFDIVVVRKLSIRSFKLLLILILLVFNAIVVQMPNHLLHIRVNQ